MARPYANAVFDLAKQAGELDRWSHMLAILASASVEPAVKALIDSPSATNERKAYQLIELVRDEVHQNASRFVQVLSSNKRLSLLPEISSQFEARKAEAERTLDVEITSAVDLTSEQLERFARALELRFEQDIHVTTTIDDALIGGAVIRAGDTVIDGSIRGKLDKLAESLSRV